MTARRPLATINGTIQEIPSGDSIATDLVPTGSAGLVDGGSPTTNFTAPRLILDFGGVS